MTWDEIFRNADGAACGEDALKVKDNARYAASDYILEKTGYDIEQDEIPEDSIEGFIREHGEIEFDERGNVVEEVIE